MSVRDDIVIAMRSCDKSYLAVSTYEEYADAILAKIIGSVPELVWDGALATLNNDCYYTAVKSMSGKTFHVNFVTRKNSFVIGRCPTPEAAKAAAQAHHVAQKTDWMMG